MGASAEISRQLLDLPAYGARGVNQVTSLAAGGACAVAAVELDLRDSLRYSTHGFSAHQSTPTKQ